MTKEELQKIRDENQEIVTLNARRKKPFILMASSGLVAALTIFVIAVSILKDGVAQTERPLYFNIMTYISLGLAILSLIALGIFIFFHIKEKRAQARRDNASSQLTGLALRKYDE